MRGEFIRGDGLVLPNNITTWGAESILRAAFQFPRYNLALWMRLVDAVYTPGLQVSETLEPTLDTNGYVPREVRVDGSDWATFGSANGEPYVESVPRVFQAVGGNFSRAISRIALSPDLARTGAIFSLSSPLPAPLLITPTTPAVERTFRYRLYLR